MYRPALKRIVTQCFVLLIILWNFIIPASNVTAATTDAMTDVRVGLTQLYAGKSSIQVKTTKLAFGFCIKDSYVSETSLSSSVGFTFTPATGYYYILQESYKDYATADAVAESLSAFGVDAYPVIVYRNSWRVYVGGSTDKTQMQNEFKRIKDQYGYTYSTLQTDNNQRILVSGSYGAFMIDGGTYAVYPQFKALVTNEDDIAVIDLGSRQYRGRIEIGRYGKSTLTAVNIINVEAYLYSVVPCEMTSTWPTEALKAQAVCARSYALTKTGYSADSSISHGYTLTDTVDSQVYKGQAFETKTAVNAVTATRGETVRYNGKTIMAFFYSTSGGRTEDGINVWGLTQSYYTGVADLYETEPEKAPWIIALTKTQIENKLSNYSVSIGSMTAMVPQIRTASGRIYALRIKGTNSNVMLQSQTIRDVLGLPSTKFKIISYGDNPDLVSMRGENGKTTKEISSSYVLSGNGIIEKISDDLTQYIVRSAENLSNFPASAPVSKNTYYFAGMGYGHGVGMSQSGAKGMAEAGFRYVEIVEYYYQGTTVE